MELDAWLNLQFTLDRVGTGEAERTENICIPVLDSNHSRSYRTVALYVGLQVLHLHLFITYLIDLGLNRSDGQLATLLLAHQGCARLGYVEFKVGIASHITQVIHIKGPS